MENHNLKTGSVKMKAAILYQPKTPLQVEEVTLEEPQEGEVLVKIVATGVCHTDLSVANGDLTTPMPIVLGHEGAGIVEQVGTRVTTVKAGDHVVLTGAGSCGKCRYCVMGRPVLCEVFRPLRFGGSLPGGKSRLRKDGQELHHFFLQSSFAGYAVVPQEVAISVRQDAPLETVGVLGCGVLTGIGSVVNTARVAAAASVAIFGCGGVGLGAVMAACLVGARQIIAVDISDNKLTVARELGATHRINAARENVVARINQVTPGGVDYTFAAVGNTDVIVQAIESIRPGGECIIMGAPPEGSRVSLDVRELLRERSIRGCSMGSSRPTLDIPRYIDLYLAGKLPIDRLVTRRYPLSEINRAFQALEEGEVIKPVILL